jgi:hypothetical protein
MKLGEVMNEASGGDEDEDLMELGDDSLELSPDFSSIFDDGGTYADIDPEQLEDAKESTPAPVSGDDPLEDAQAMIALGLHDEALAALEGQGGLAAATLIAQARNGSGDLNGACSQLQLAVSEADETDPSYLEALWELAELYTRRRKVRAASRLLEEIEELDSSFRAAERKARARALKRLSGS